MEKTIKLAMCADKSLKVYVNQREKYTIDTKNRSISAEKIYEIIDFTIGDHYSVMTENESDVDNQVLEFFEGLFTDITNKVNTIKTDAATHGTSEKTKNRET